jgi:antitoxin (DNA-binding transcriptional repressor) of toxin-antitoxin stability system
VQKNTSTTSETVSVQEAVARLPELLERIRRGAEILIAQDDVPIARLAPVHAASEPRTFGGFEGQIRVREDFDAPLPDELWSRGSALRTGRQPRP